MDFKEFEGYKKIKNEKEYTIEQIYDAIKKYEDATGEVKYGSYEDELKIIVDVDGKYYIDIYLKDNFIIIERKLEAGATKTTNVMNDSKSVAHAHADRMIDQLYDLIKEYVTTGCITEYITKAQKVLFVKEKKRTVLKGALSLGKIFEVKDENKEKVYEIVQSTVNQVFFIKNILTRREEGSLNYKDKEQNKFSILKTAYELIDLEKEESSTKLKFVSKKSKNHLEVSADYTENHYLIELDKIVIGSIDCLDPNLRQEYRVEVNSLEHTYILLAIIALIDITAKINI